MFDAIPILAVTRCQSFVIGHDANCTFAPRGGLDLRTHILGKLLSDVL